MKALIVDDERLARVELRRLLRAHPTIDVVGEVSSGAEAVTAIERLAPDVVFLDIQMPGMTGLDVLDRLPRVPQVIFTTAHDEFAVKAFEVNALDYLLKPVLPERLAAAIDRLERPAPTVPIEHVFVREGERCWIVRVAEIALLESEGNYTRLHFRGESPLIRRSLNDLEHRLATNTFIRANRVQILNMKWIDGVEIGAAGSLVVALRGGRSVEMSRRQSERLKKILKL